jgi:hypothetical protein
VKEVFMIYCNFIFLFYCFSSGDHEIFRRIEKLKLKLFSPTKYTFSFTNTFDSYKLFYFSCDRPDVLLLPFQRCFIPADETINVDSIIYAQYEEKEEEVQIFVFPVGNMNEGVEIITKLKILYS